MPKTKTWNCALVGAKSAYGCAAVIASNDPAVYPAGGEGVEISAYSSDNGSLQDVAGALVNELVKHALDEGVTSVLIFSYVPLYEKETTVENIMGCSLHTVIMEPDGEPDISDPDPKQIRRRAALDALAVELEKLKENSGRIVFEHPPLMPGQYVLYKNGDRYELGRVKRVTDGGAFVYYSEGETASKTPWDCIILIENARCIQATSLGGADAEAMFDRTGGAR